jgi:hypothetical protein
MNYSFRFRIAGVLFVLVGMAHLLILTEDRVITWVITGLGFVGIGIYFYLSGGHIILKELKHLEEKKKGE